MKPSNATPRSAAIVICVVASLVCGCKHDHYPFTPVSQEMPLPGSPLGTLSDPIWKNQEANAEVSDFVIYQNEFDYNTARLNLGGEDHVKEIALRLQTGHNMPVIVERSMTSERQNTEYKYPVHTDPELDMQRRDVVVRALSAMGIFDAERRVVVAPALAHGQKATEAQRAYYRGMLWDGNSGNSNNMGGGSGFGGGRF
ncbi:MAG TPA: hypothetical protein VMY42_03535 [Thermoguttaceae bacterium]|nr:hypothetical protein [Thermoguttaceae bacterium]